MALAVWLPLNGTLKNNGYASIDAVVSGAVVSSGKLCQSYSFDGSDDYISLTGEIFYSIITGGNVPFTIAFWIQHNEASRGVIFGDYNLTGGINFNIELSAAHNLRFYWAGSPDLSSTFNIEQDTWAHIAYTYDGTTLLLYVDGVVQQTWTGPLTTRTKTQGAYYLGRDKQTGATALEGKINDFRLYDHCLSIAEVQELAKGLVVHLKCDEADGTTIYDNSGYGFNGSIINTPVFTTDTGRYLKSLHFTATNQHVQISNLNVTDFTNNYSFAWWAKISSNGPMHWGFKDGVRLNGLYNGNLWNTGDSSSNPLYNPGTTTQVTKPTLNTWHHWVMTGDGTKCRVYQDGVLWAEAKTYKAITGTTIFLNGWDNVTTYASNDYYIDDFRIYSTALTAEQVSSLYFLGLRIDDAHNAYGYEYNEIADNESTTISDVITTSSTYTTTTESFHCGSYQTYESGKMVTKYISATRTIVTFNHSINLINNKEYQFTYPLITVSGKKFSYSRKSSANASTQYYYLLYSRVAWHLDIYDENDNLLTTITVANKTISTTTTNNSAQPSSATLTLNHSLVFPEKYNLPNNAYGKLKLDYCNSTTIPSNKHLIVNEQNPMAFAVMRIGVINSELQEKDNMTINPQINDNIRFSAEQFLEI